MIQSRYPSMQLFLSFDWYVSFGRPMTKNDGVWQLLESQKEGCEHGKELKISHPDVESLHATLISFVVLSMEEAKSYANHSTKSTTIQAPSFYPGSKQLLNKLYYM